MKKIVIIAAVLLVALAGFLVVKGKKTKTAEKTYQPVTVARADLQRTVKATGIVQPQNRLAIKPSVSGRLEDVLVREGQWVKRGQTLALMSSADRAALLDAARARGPEELARWEKMYKPAPLLAPLSGTVIARNFEPGQSATTSDEVLVLADHLIVKAQVDETDIGSVKVGQDCSIVLDAYSDQAIEGRVDHIAYEATTVSNVTIYYVEVLPKKVPAFMRSGMTGNVEFTVEAREGVLVLPTDALHQQADGSTTVLVPDPKNPKKPRSVTVVTGMSQGKQVELVSGDIKEGDTLLVEGLPQMQGASGSSPFMMRGPNRQTQRAASGRNPAGARNAAGGR